jgi:heptosyltransferase-2
MIDELRPAGGGVPSRILLVKLADLGDLLTVTPALRALRASFADARIDALVTPSSASLLRGLPTVDRVLTFDKFAYDRPSAALRSLPGALSLANRLRLGGYDILVLCHHLTTAYGTLKYAMLAFGSGARVRAGLDNGRGGFLTHRATDFGFGVRHEVDYWLSVTDSIGAQTRQPRLEIALSEEDESEAEKLWQALEFSGQDVAIVHPGSGVFSLARRWPAGRFAHLGDALSRRLGLRIAILAGPAPGESELATAISRSMSEAASIVTDIPSPQRLAAFLRRARVVVGNDSGVVHLAAAVEAPVVAIFGPTNHAAWGPYPPSAPRNRVVREPLACSPCVHRGHRFGTPAGCPARTCLDLLDVDRVFEAVERVLSATAPGDPLFALTLHHD